MESLFARPVIPLAWCQACGKETVLYGALDPATGALVRRCAACDASLACDGGRMGVAVEYRSACELEGTPFVAGEPVSDSGGCGGGCSTGECATCDSAATCGH